MMFRTTLVYLTRLFVRFRYKVTIHHDRAGYESARGTLFVCTHAAAFIETALIRYALWHSHRPIHVASELLMHKTDPVSLLYRKYDELLGNAYIPYFRDTTNSIKIARLNALVARMADDLGKGKSYFAFPSGLNREVPYEDLGANSLVHRVLQANPDINIAYVRSTGFWGSVFSNAVAENDLVKNFFFMLGSLVGAFGMLPKKAASMDIRYETRDLRSLSRAELNQHVTDVLNECYPKNDNGRREEPLNWVSYSRRGPQFLRRKIGVGGDEQEDAKSYDSEAHRKLRDRIAQMTHSSSDDILPNAVIGEELGIDSIEIFDLILYLRNQFHVEVDSVERLHRVRDVYEAIERRADPTSEAQPFETSGSVSFPRAGTLPEMFLRQVERKHLGRIQDTQCGTIGYGEMQKTVEQIYLSVRSYDDERIGVLLPQSSLFYCCLLALQMARKVPVILNYRNRSLFAGDELTPLGVSRVLTSAAFVETQQAVDFGSDLNDKIVFLEEALFSGILWKRLCRMNRFLFDYTRAAPEDTAFILFTSGSESKAKAVPLTHKNVISAMRGRYEFMQLTDDDVFLSILPSYHSMGVVACGFLPILTGVNVCFVANPGNIGEIGRLARAIEPSILVLTPTILRSLVEGDADALRKLRIINTGSEPVRDDLRALAHRERLRKNWVHGYGTTETASTLTLNPSYGENLSVGRALAHAEIRIVDQDDYEVERPRGERGLVLVRSDATFSGYVESGAGDKLVSVRGDRWLNTGDIGYLDDDGNLYLTDRLSRTIKVGGEMISLAAVEDALAGRFSQDGPSLDLVLTVGEDVPGLVLHTTLDIDDGELAEFFRRRFRNIVRVSHVHRVQEIPRNETGKILYGRLRADDRRARA